MASMVLFSRSTSPSIALRPSQRACSMMICISRQPSPRPLRSERNDIRMQLHNTEHLPAGRVDSDKRNRTRVVDLRQAGDEPVAQIAHRREEAQPQILGRLPDGEGAKHVLVVRAHWTHEDRPIRQTDRSLPLLGIRPHRKARMAGPRCPPASGAIATRASTAMTPSWSARSGLMSSSRISGTSAASCASFTSTHERNLVNTSGGHVAVGLQRVRDARARDQLTGEVEVEGWQRQRLHQEIGRLSHSGAPIPALSNTVPENGRTDL